MKTHTIAAALVLGSASLAGAAVYDDASLLLKFDTASSGQVSGAGQIVDSSSFNRTPSNVYQTNTANLTWSSVPPTGPGGTPSVDPLSRGLQFNPTLHAEDVLVPGTGTVDVPARYEDQVNSAGFRYSTAMATGSATFATRFIWDGHVSNDGSTYAWLFSNGHGDTTGWLVGINASGRIGQFQYKNGDFRSPTDFTITPGVWYDFAVVMLDNAEEGSGVDTLKFYLQAAGGQAMTAEILGPVNSTSSAYTNVGSESLSTSPGQSNTRKAFKGNVDFISVWDRGLSGAEVEGIFAIPTPAALPAGALLLGLLATRRRR